MSGHSADIEIAFSTYAVKLGMTQLAEHTQPPVEQKFIADASRYFKNIDKVFAQHNVQHHIVNPADVCI